MTSFVTRRMAALVATCAFALHANSHVAAQEAEAAGDDAAQEAAPPATEDAAPVAPLAIAEERVEAVVPAMTRIKLMLDEEVSTNSHKKGDQFSVTVVEDLVHNDTVVVPAGAKGWGEITFASKKGAFGSPGIISMSLRSLKLGDRIVTLDGRYREEGKGNGGAVFASWLAVGVFSGFIKGRSGYIEQGRELAAKLGQDLTYIVGENAVLEESPVEIAEETDASGIDAEAEAAPTQEDLVVNDVPAEVEAASAQ